VASGGEVVSVHPLEEALSRSVERVHAALMEAKEREAAHWVGVLGPRDVYQVPGRDLGWRLVDGAGETLSEVRIVATGYVMSIEVDRTTVTELAYRRAGMPLHDEESEQ
jgi:hypothetical protein